MKNTDNIYVQRKVLDYIKETKGRPKSTMRKYNQALNMWDRITNRADYRSFSRKVAKEFKKELRKQKYRGEYITSSTITSVLLCLKTFFEVLSLEPGYRSKINRSDIAFLHPLNSDLAIASSTGPARYPTSQQMLMMIVNIQNNTEIGRMFQALIAFLCCTGARLDAVASFPLGCFYPEILLADQDPKKGVRTKYRKHIRTYLFRFDEDMVNIVLKWHKYLLDKGFSYNDPMFPACETKRIDGLSFADSDTLSHNFLTAQRVYEIIKQIALDAGLEKSFNPHSFRHGVIAIAERRATNIEQFKAVSQNVGHSKPLTTFAYAKLTDEQVKANIQNLSISDSKNGAGTIDNKLFERFLQFEKMMKLNEESDKD